MLPNATKALGNHKESRVEHSTYFFPNYLKYYMDRTSNFYANPTYGGGGFPVFVGSRRRRGGGVLGILKGFAMPMLKKGATQALGMAKDVAGDMMMGRSLKSSLMKHGLRRAKRLGSDVLSTAMGSFSNRSKAPPGAATKRRRTHVQRRPASKARQTRKRRRNNF